MNAGRARGTVAWQASSSKLAANGKVPSRTRGRANFGRSGRGTLTRTGGRATGATPVVR